ncbi:glycosyltransferase family 39 protein [candidate division KSB1 bacterium]|nr:glycosyltransferase family 39 protein [candidate division KSB1 bacterium]
MDLNKSSVLNRWWPLLLILAAAFVHGYGINKLTLNSDELHPARAIVGEDWSLDYSPWPEEAEREYYKDWPVQFPPLFGLLTRLNVTLWDGAPVSLRLLPTLFSLFAVACAWFVFKHRLPILLAMTATLMLAMVSDKFIYYSKFFKHYTADVFLTAALVLLTLKLLQKSSWALWIAFALASSIGLWLGFASVYVSSSCFLVLFLNSVRRSAPFISSLSKFALSALLFSLSFLLLFKFSISTAVSNPTFIREWQMQIFNMQQISDINYVLRFLGRIVFHILLLPRYFFFDSWIVAVAANILILIWIYKKIADHEFYDLLMSFMPLTLVILASFLGKYPFSAGRLSLFLLPLWILMMVEGFYHVQIYMAKRSKFLFYPLATIAVFSMLLGVYTNIKRVSHLDYGGGRRVDLLFQTLSEKAQDGDTVFLHWGAILPFYYYFTDHGTGFQNHYAIPHSPQDSVRVLYGEEHSLTGNYDRMYQRISAAKGRLWVSFCHLWPQQDMLHLIDFLNAERALLAEFTFKGCTLLLYQPVEAGASSPDL